MSEVEAAVEVVQEDMDAVDMECLQKKVSDNKQPVCEGGRQGHN